ncbi:hypothetical protein [Pseudomonas syringae]|uniref:hypothetical protein n=1 Tax=Pseudomonas syringae TaxID=317 RepID=UPI0018E657BF|nr:hypothetical protein [Pseudomonas syringae]MBI6748184.1 hypothetical protein [Pseudomonas syringae]MBI6758731.1 hypothetical protein [Pseudomonas syringae]MBI6828044.1 hypothetical protein [Pseudomonas syringae]
MKAIVACLATPILLLIFGIAMSPDSIPNILSLLVAIAGAIFTIMSIWVAFLYPNVLKTLKGENLVNIDFSAGGEDTLRLKQIISVIVQSATTMIVSIILLVFLSIKSDFSFATQEWLATCVQFLLAFVSGLQIFALISTIRINLSFMDALERQRARRAKDWDI